jgi:hypothetical protein
MTTPLVPKAMVHMYNDEMNCLGASLIDAQNGYDRAMHECIKAMSEGNHAGYEKWMERVDSLQEIVEQQFEAALEKADIVHNLHKLSEKKEGEEASLISDRIQACCMARLIHDGFEEDVFVVCKCHDCADADDRRYWIIRDERLVSVSIYDLHPILNFK